MYRGEEPHKRSQIYQLISGALEVYVDDFFGVSLKDNAESDVEKASTVLRSLFNSDCVEVSKTVISRSMTVIGYVIDLDQSMVSISLKNFYRVVYGLGFIESSKSVSVKMMQRFGSWVSRYANICIFLKPLLRSMIMMMSK